MTSDATSYQGTRGRCLGCGYPLRGLAEPRCPECGRGFDPLRYSTMDFSNAGPLARLARRWWSSCKAALILGGNVGFSWLAYFALEGHYSILIFAPPIFLAVRRRRVAIVLFLLCSPIGGGFVMNAREYAQGSPRYVNGRSVIAAPRGSIDPLTRIRGPITTAICGMHGENEWVRNLTEGWAGAVMYRLTGPPRGAYTGPYPSAAEASAALKGATRFSMPPDWNGTIPLPTGDIFIAPQWFDSRDAPRPSAATAATQPSMQASAVIWKGQCLIVNVPRDVPSGAASDTYLIDLTRMEMFAMYSVVP